MIVTLEQIGKLTKCDSCGGNYSVPPGGLISGNIKCPYCENEVEVIADTPKELSLKDTVSKINSNEKGLEITFNVGSLDSSGRRSDAGETVITGFYSFGLIIGGVVNFVGALTRMSENNESTDQLIMAFSISLLGFIFFYFLLRPLISTSKIIIKNGLVVIVNAKKDVYNALSVHGFSKRSSYQTLMHLSDGSVRIMPFISDKKYIDTLIVELNRALKINQKITPESLHQKQEEIPIDKTTVKKTDSLPQKPGKINSRISLPKMSQPEEAECFSCGAVNKLRVQLKTSDHVLCQYCNSTLNMRILAPEDLEERIVRGKSQTSEFNEMFLIEDIRVPYRHPLKLKAVILIHLFTAPLVFGLLHVAFTKGGLLSGFMVIFLMLSPLLYYILSWQRRGNRKDTLLSLSKITWAPLFLGVYYPIYTMWCYRQLGKINKYCMKISKAGLFEKYRFGRKCNISLNDIEHAVIFRWDWFTTKIRHEKDDRYNGIVKDRAIWGFALALKNGGTYFSKYLGEKSTADMIVRRINYELGR
ncbi:MAG: hypothetical protein OEZ13_08790 [Spirochaetia bacterium]|nr:hypothetical protein [Spirochaetia bacterium]